MSVTADAPATVGDRPRTTRPSVTVLRVAGRTARFRVGLAMFVVVVVLALLGPLVATGSPEAFVGTPYSPPSGEALLGTDNLGRDVLSRMLHGGWSVLWMSFAATILGVTVGAAVGMLSGYAHSRVDSTVMAGADIVLAFPNIVLVLLCVSVLGPGKGLIVALVAVTHAPRVARLCRSVTLDVRHHEFCEAVEVLGVPRKRILVHEVLPNLATPLAVEFGLRVTWSVSIIATLSFLGFGIQPPQPDWGLMINENRNGLLTSPIAVLAPAACIMLLTIGINFIAEAISRAVARVDAANDPVDVGVTEVPG